VESEEEFAGFGAISSEGEAQVQGGRQTGRSTQGNALLTYSLRTDSLRSLPSLQLFSSLSSSSDLSSLKPPSLPSQKWSLFPSAPKSAELQDMAKEMNAWLHGVLGSAKKVSMLPVVREFLDLDRPIVKDEEEEATEEGNQQQQEDTTME
jgi:hypothetical protein